jgi:Tfp pilus assembly PilM family ATPase
MACRPLLKGRGLEPIVNIGWAAAHIVVLCNGSVVHERSLPEYGLRQIRSSISEAFALEPDVADYILREYGVGADAEERDEAPDLADDVGVQAAGALSGLASELRESIAYTSREFAVSGVERLLVHGEGAAIRGLDRSLGEGLACEVVVVTPERVTAWDSMPEDLRRSPMLVTACGLGQHPGD